jgi:hypothetical protein
MLVDDKLSIEQAGLRADQPCSLLDAGFLDVNLLDVSLLAFHLAFLLVANYSENLTNYLKAHLTDHLKANSTNRPRVASLLDASFLVDFHDRLLVATLLDVSLLGVSPLVDHYDHLLVASYLKNQINHHANQTNCLRVVSQLGA